MKAEHTERGLLKPNVVSVRYSDNEIERFRTVIGQLALPVDVSISSVARTLSLVGLQSFERSQQKPKKGKDR